MESQTKFISCLPEQKHKSIFLIFLRIKIETDFAPQSSFDVISIKMWVSSFINPINGIGDGADPGWCNNCQYLSVNNLESWMSHLQVNLHIIRRQLRRFWIQESQFPPVVSIKTFIFYEILSSKLEKTKIDIKCAFPFFHINTLDRGKNSEVIFSREFIFFTLYENIQLIHS